MSTERDMLCQHCRGPMRVLRETDDFFAFQCTRCSPWGMTKVVSKPKHRAKAKAERDLERRIRAEQEARERESRRLYFT